MLIPIQRLTASDLYVMVDFLRADWEYDPLIAQSSYRPGQPAERSGYALARLRANLRQLPDEHRRKCLIRLGQLLTGELPATDAFALLRLAVSEWDNERKAA